MLLEEKKKILKIKEVINKIDGYDWEISNTNHANNFFFFYVTNFNEVKYQNKILNDNVNFHVVDSNG